MKKHTHKRIRTVNDENIKDNIYKHNLRHVESSQIALYKVVSYCPKKPAILN